MKKQDLVILSLITLALITSFYYDFEIAKYLYNPDDTIAMLINDYANHLAYFVGAFALFGLALNTNDLIKKTIYETCAVIMVFAIALIMHINLGFELIDTLSFSLLGAYVLYVFVHRIKIFKSKLYFKWFLFTSLSFVLLLFIPNLVKTFVLRFRPYLYMGGCLDYSFYLKWLPFNFEENFRSLPSFHVSMSAFLMVFAVFPHQSEKARNLSIYRSLLWIGVVGYYRMVIGAHFLSDVLISLLLSYVILRFLYLKIVK